MYLTVYLFQMGNHTEQSRSDGDQCRETSAEAVLVVVVMDGDRPVADQHTAESADRRSQQMSIYTAEDDLRSQRGSSAVVCQV